MSKQSNKSAYPIRQWSRYKKCIQKIQNTYEAPINNCLLAFIQVDVATAPRPWGAVPKRNFGLAFIIGQKQSEYVKNDSK